MPEPNGARMSPVAREPRTLPADSPLDRKLLDDTGDVALIVMAKTMVLYAMPLLVLAMAATGASGMKLAGSSRAPVIATKKRRMAVVAANGIGVLVPSAIFLAWRAGSGMFDTWFYAVQALELTAGAVNFALLAANARTGRRMTRGRRAVRRK